MFLLIREGMVSLMKYSKTPLANTDVVSITGNVYRAIVSFDDRSFLTLLFRAENFEIYPCTSADKFIYSSLSEDIQHKIFTLCRIL